MSSDRVRTVAALPASLGIGVIAGAGAWVAVLLTRSVAIAVGVIVVVPLLAIRALFRYLPLPDRLALTAVAAALA